MLRLARVETSVGDSLKPTDCGLTWTQRVASFAKPAFSSRRAWSGGSAECSNTTPSHLEPRRAVATRHRPAAAVYPVLTPSAPGYGDTSRGLLLSRKSLPPFIGSGSAVR